MEHEIIFKVKKARNGDKEAFILLIETYKDYMYKVSCIYLKNDSDCADAIQETILSMYQKIHTLKKPRYFKTWMTKILINKCNDMLKLKNRTIPIGDYIENSHSNGVTMDTDELEFRSILKPLKQEHKIVLLLYYLEKYSVNEMADMLDIAPGTVKSRLHRGREAFKRLYYSDTSTLKPEVNHE